MGYTGAVAPRTDKGSGAVPDVPDALPGTAAGTDSSAADEITGVVRTALDAAGRAGSASAAGVGDAAERAARALARRVVAGAATRRHALSDRSSLARALSEKPPAPAI